MSYTWPGSTSETCFVTYNSLMLGSSDLVFRVNRLANLSVTRDFIIIGSFDLLSVLSRQYFGH